MAGNHDFAGDEPTREFPTLTAHNPAAHNAAANNPAAQYSAGPWPAPSHPSAPGYPLPEYPSPIQPGAARPERKRRTVGLVSAGVAGASLLVIGLGGGYLMGAGSTGATQNVATISSAGQGQLGQAPADGAAPGLEASPTPQTPPDSPSSAVQDNTGGGLSSTAVALGAAVGTVSAINGASFTVQGLDGVPCNVITTNNTRVATLRGSGGVRNLSVGDPVLVKGSGSADGSITADLVIAGAFPDLGAGTS